MPTMTLQAAIETVINAPGTLWVGAQGDGASFDSVETSGPGPDAWTNYDSHNVSSGRWPYFFTFTVTVRNTGDIPLHLEW